MCPFRSDRNGIFFSKVLSFRRRRCCRRPLPRRGPAPRLAGAVKCVIITQLFCTRRQCSSYITLYIILCHSRKPPNVGQPIQGPSLWTCFRGIRLEVIRPIAPNPSLPPRKRSCLPNGAITTRLRPSKPVSWNLIGLHCTVKLRKKSTRLTDNAQTKKKKRDRVRERVPTRRKKYINTYMYT